MVAAIVAIATFLSPEGALSGAIRSGIRRSLLGWGGFAVLPIVSLSMSSKPFGTMPPGKLGSTSSAELSTIVAAAKRGQPAACILNENNLKPIAVNALSLNVVLSYNAIYLSSRLLATFNGNESRAVRLHESAYIHECICDETLH